MSTERLQKGFKSTALRYEVSLSKIREHGSEHNFSYKLRISRAVARNVIAILSTLTAGASQRH